MLVLSRKPGEQIHIGDGIVVTLVCIDGNRVRVGIEAPAEVGVLRKELYDEQSSDESHRFLSSRHPR